MTITDLFKCLQKLQHDSNTKHLMYQPKLNVGLTGDYLELSYISIFT